MGDSDLGGGGGVEFWRAEAERLTAQDVVLRARVVELEGQVGALAEKVSVLAKLAFGDVVGEGGQANAGRGRGRPGRRVARWSARRAAGEAWPRAAAGLAGARSPGLFASADPRGGP